MTRKQRLASAAWLLCQWVNAVNVPLSPTNADIANASTANNIVVTWDSQAPQPTSFEVWRSINGAAFTLLATVAGNITTTTDPGVMGADAIWTYKVRSVRGAFNSGFSNTVSIGNGLIDTHGNNPVFSDMVVMVGILNYNGSVTCVSLSFPKLRISDTISLFNLTVFTSLSAPVLTQIKNSSMGGDFTIVSPAFNSLTLTSLATIDGTFACTGSKMPALVSLPALTTIGNSLSFDQITGMVTFSAPSLISVAGSANLSQCVNLTTLVFTGLQSVGVGGGFLQLFLNAGFVTLSFPALAFIGGDLDFGGCNALTSVSLPALTSAGTIGGAYYGGGANQNGACPLLATLTCPNVILADFMLVDFNGDALAVASVDNVLHRGVVSGNTGASYDLSAGTNATPDAAGQADKATLIGAGNTVATN